MTTMTSKAPVTVRNVGTLLVTCEGRGPGPSFGLVFTASRGARGYIVGRLNLAALGAGLLDRAEYPTYAAAVEAAWHLTD